MINVLTGEVVRDEDVMARKIDVKDMIGYLEEIMAHFKDEETRFGKSDYLMKKLDDMIACKEMVEALIGYPVNLRKDGTVTLGF